MPPEPLSDSAETIYQSRSRQFASEAAELSRHDGKLTLARGLTFLFGASCLGMSYLDAGLRPVWIGAGIVGLLVFLAVATWHDWIQRRCERLRQLCEINEWQLARIARRWQSIPVPHVDVPPEHAAVANDLDLFGRASIFQLVNLAHTPRGIAMLRDWILEPADSDEVRSRQAAVKELIPELALREELALRGHMLASSLAGPEEFIRWGESEAYYLRRPWTKWLSRLLPVLGVLALLALGFGQLSANVGGTLLVTVLVANVLFSVLFTGSVHDIFNNISTRNGEMRHYLALFELLAGVPSGVQRLQLIQNQAVREQHGALHQLMRLRLVMWLANLRHASLLSILYFGLQATVLWDFHVLYLLERWHQQCGRRLRQWFDALAQLEALCSLSCLAFDNPSWCFPQVDSKFGSTFRAAGLGHPLLDNSTRVNNDVEIGPAGTVVLVTGSNMSGKSTLLRAIGVNALLGESGGPVCAEAMELPPMTVTTSMRIQDSLENGVSFYMAELKRLKAIVDQASGFATRRDRVLLYLLDEILQGTNSVERHIAVARVLAHLVAEGAIGAVSTHDLDLARSSELADRCRAVHFRETLHDDRPGGQMTFDYRLRPGVATTTNALKLLKLVGLD